MSSLYYYYPHPPHALYPLSPSSTLSPSPTSPPFPYTTLFRSWHEPDDPGGCKVLLNDLVRRREPRLDRGVPRSEEHMSELQSHSDLVCRLLLEKKKKKVMIRIHEIT